MINIFVTADCHACHIVRKRPEKTLSHRALSSGSRPTLKKRWKQLGFVGVSTVTYRVLSEQKQLGEKQFEYPVLKGI